MENFPLASKVQVPLYSPARVRSWNTGRFRLSASIHPLSCSRSINSTGRQAFSIKLLRTDSQLSESNPDVSPSLSESGLPTSSDSEIRESLSVSEEVPVLLPSRSSLSMLELLCQYIGEKLLSMLLFLISPQSSASLSVFASLFGLEFSVSNFSFNSRSCNGGMASTFLSVLAE